jgi:hypothetical protein
MSTTDPNLTQKPDKEAPLDAPDAASSIVAVLLAFVFATPFLMRVLDLIEGMFQRGAAGFTVQLPPQSMAAFFGS